MGFPTQAGFSPDQAYLYGSGAYDPLLDATGQGGATLTPPPPYQRGPALQNLDKISTDLAAQYSPSALQAAQLRANQALDWKRQRINDAMTNLSKVGANAPGAVNLPMLMAGSAMLRPTFGGFAASLGNAGQAAGEVIGQQRNIDMETALKNAQLGISEADVGVEQQTGDLNFGEKMLDLSMKAGEQATRTEAYEQAARERDYAAYLRGNATVQAAKERANAQRDVANIQSNWQIDRNDLMANKNRYRPLNRNNADGTASLYLDTTTGQTITGPPLQSTAQRGQTAMLADELMHTTDTNGQPLARNTLEALQLIRDPNLAAKHADAINGARERLAQTQAQYDPMFQNDQAGAIKKWRKFYGLPETPTPVTAPAPGAAPAPKPGAPAAAAGQIPQAPIDPTQRKPNTVYMTPKGKFLWSGTGWRPVSGQ